MVLPNREEPTYNEVPRLLELIRETGYEIIQTNGQRRYGPPPDWEGPPPPKGSEVFVGKIPRNCFEDELVPFMEKAGKLYEMRLMMDFSGSNRGFAFVSYTSPEDATWAIIHLNDTEIRRGERLGVVKSGDNCKLFIGGLPKCKSKEEIKKELSQFVDGIDDVVLYKDSSDKRKNRGFAFVEFRSHRAAAVARRIFIYTKTKLFGKNVAVDWAEPEIEVDDNIMSKVKVLYIRNLLLDTSESRLKDVFEERLNMPVEKVKKIKDFAFIHFSSREEAEKALEEMNGFSLDGATIEVHWAKPVNGNYHRLRKQETKMKISMKINAMTGKNTNSNSPEPTAAWQSSEYYGSQRTTIYSGTGVEGAAGYLGAQSHFHMSQQRYNFHMSVPETQETDEASGYQVHWTTQESGYEQSQFVQSGPVLCHDMLMAPPLHTANGMASEIGVSYVLTPPPMFYVPAPRNIAVLEAEASRRFCRYPPRSSF